LGAGVSRGTLTLPLTVWVSNFDPTFDGQTLVFETHRTGGPTLKKCAKSGGMSEREANGGKAIEKAMSQKDVWREKYAHFEVWSGVGVWKNRQPK